LKEMDQLFKSYEKEYKKAKKKFVKSLKKDKVIKDNKIILFQEYQFSDLEVKQILEKTYPEYEFVSQERTNLDLILNIHFKRKEVIS